MSRSRRWATRLVAGMRHALGLCLWARPAARAHAAGTGSDLLRSRAQLLAENALLRHQLLVLWRSVKRPAITSADRALLVLLASRVRVWRQALGIVQPETLLRWHRAGFRTLWRRKSRPGPGRPPLPAQTVALIRRLVADNPRRGAERIRGELQKLGIRVGKRTIQTYGSNSRPPRPRGQSWATFLRHHGTHTWACDFLPVTDLLFHPRHAFVIVALKSRRVVHVGVTRRPTDAWVAQQLREATPFGQRPTYLIRYNDSKYGPTFSRVASASGIIELRTAYRAPRQNATCERFLGSVRRECRDHILVLGEARLRRVLREYAGYFNQHRPHQGRQQQVPDAPAGGAPPDQNGRVDAITVLGGLHHAYQRAA